MVCFFSFWLSTCFSLVMQLKWRPPTDLLAAASSAHNSCMTSDVGRSCSASPESTGYASEDESVESDVTLEEAVELFSDFGHPLERMPRSQGHIAELDLDSAGRFGHGTIYHPYKTCSSRCSSPSLPFVTSYTMYVKRHFPFTSLTDGWLLQRLSRDGRWFS